ncbi:Uncharacterised protein [Mycobacterium tuberculosis]|uniref:Uncharacterized protein n=1 Tax=Mycobacterium tuberculosis TaxID=1773 RepID=A0A655AGE7_MYCTX|nr:Uncharacterised protein [Mycobacterium tuberculosis]CKS98325.1 Uncharacterised protein [Mycobacterium tuberculosis]CKT04824.1 Uncharacterised protein [Mycobacterium tuberculosis]CKU31925.1 Uncharacterised protein [Mycobacterium tuberculosis]COY26789.1 Uncharacterised protein [Mycobacterium tuberculosis]
MNSEPNAMISKNHLDSGILVATPPAMARIKYADDTTQISTTA